MRKLILLTVAMACLSGFGQSLQWRNPTTTQFGSNNYVLTIKSGVLLTNPVVNSGTITGNGAGLTNLNIPASSVTNLGTAAYSNSASFQNANAILSNVVSGASNAYVGSLTGDGSGITNIQPQNIISNGSQIVNGVLATNTMNNGFYIQTGDKRKVTLDGSGLTNLYASNVVSGGVLPQGTVAANTGTNGNVLMFDGTSRVWSNAPSLATIYPQSTLNVAGILTSQGVSVFTNNHAPTANFAGAISTSSGVTAGSAQYMNFSAGAAFRPQTAGISLESSSPTTLAPRLYFSSAAASGTLRSTNPAIWAVYGSTPQILFQGSTTNVEDVVVSGSVTATNTISSRPTPSTTPGFRSTVTNNMIMACPDGGSWILRVANDGTLTTVTNTSGL